MHSISKSPGLKPQVFQLLNLQGLGFLPCLVLAGLGACLFAWPSGKILAETNQQNQQSLPEWIQPTSFKYSPEGKQDPFQPFIETQEEGGQGSDMEQQPQRILTPLQRVRPSQLKLVGILWEPQQPAQALAMVELPNGKGYVLRQGTKVGNQQGRVISISPGQVVIQEQTRSITGQEQSQNVVLKLKHSAGDQDE
jgi:type IV pilus assembly protein PilP